MKKRAKKIWKSQNEKCIEVTCPNGHTQKYILSTTDGASKQIACMKEKIEDGHVIDICDYIGTYEAGMVDWYGR